MKNIKKNFLTRLSKMSKERLMYDIIVIACVISIMIIIVGQAIKIDKLNEKVVKLNTKCTKQEETINEYLLESNEQEDYINVLTDDNIKFEKEIEEKNKKIAEYENEINTLKKKATSKKSSTKVSTANIDRSKVEKDVEGKEYYIVNARITSYCSCARCCGKWASNRPKDENGNDIVYTASGKRAVPKYTLGASTAYAFGTKVYVPGVGVCEVMDRGSGVKSAAHFDMYFSSHSEALKWHNKVYECKVYI